MQRNATLLTDVLNGYKYVYDAAKYLCIVSIKVNNNKKLYVLLK